MCVTGILLMEIYYSFMYRYEQQSNKKFKLWKKLKLYYLKKYKFEMKIKAWNEAKEYQEVKLAFYTWDKWILF